MTNSSPTLTHPRTITADQMEAMAYTSGAPIELSGDLAFLTCNGQEYVAVQDGWVA